MLSEEGFDSRGYFSMGKSDWYTIGGRWSGTLTRVIRDKEIEKKFWAEVKKIQEKHREIWKTTFARLGTGNEWNEAYPKINTKENEELVALERQYYPKTKISIWERENPFNSYGFPDDCKVLTPRLLEALKEQYPDVEVYDAINCQEIAVKDIDKKRCYKVNIVVVDYHY